MPNQTPEQRAEEAINDYFVDTPLTTEEHTLAVQIAKEIYYETESKALALGEWRERVNQFEQDLHTRLSQTDTPLQRAALRFSSLFLQYTASEAAKKIFSNPQERLTFLEHGLEHAENFLTQRETAAGVREMVLRLYVNTGLTLEAAPFNDAERELEYKQRGLEHAENFLTQGETAAGVRKWMLFLYNSISSRLGNSGQQAIQHLPALGFWSWISLAKAEQRAEILHNWRLHLQTAPANPEFTAAFQAFLHTLLLKWHDPKKPHRHSTSTETLLAISESLYGLEQAKENQRLKTVYRCLEDLDDSAIVLELEVVSVKQAILNKKLDALNSLDKLSVIQKLRRWFAQSQLHKLSQKETELTNDSYWQTQVEKAETVLVNWFMPAIHKQLPMQFPLNELSAILLGILLANTHRKTEEPLETILDTWQQHLPWQNAETLQTALPGDWQEWAENTDEPILDEWIADFLANPIVHRLNIAESQMYFEQPDLQQWFKELKEGNADKLAAQLQKAWETAQEKAKYLAELFMALSDFDYHYPLFPLVQHDPDDFAFQSALAAVIFGDAPKQIRQKVQTWLQQQGALDKTSVPNTLKSLKHRLTRAVTIYEPSDPPLANTVHEWAKVRFKEVLTTAPEPETLWYLLERARISLTGLMMKLPEGWDQELGENLWRTLRDSITWIAEGNTPDEKTQWPLFTIWLDTINEWFSKLPEVETCQAYLQPKEILVQPFFDPVQKRLRILWMDKKALIFKDLTDNCALESLWFADESLITEWMDGLKILNNRGIPKNLEKVMDSEPVQTFANQLRDWAEAFSQITIIFPAPLGQLPWEALPQLENKLVREISVAHWLKLKTSRTEHEEQPADEEDEPERKHWVVSDPGGKEECMFKEAQWVANHFNTNLHLPCPSVFDALQHFAHSQHIHLSMHGNYERNNPLKSGLLLETEKNVTKIELPLWTLTHTNIPANTVLLSACETNLNGVDTEGLLTPIGIGPTIAAAGAKTVVGTLWACHDIAALCFSYYFYQIAEKEPNLPWHQVVAQARHKLKETTKEELETIAEEVQIDGKCADNIEVRKIRAKDRNKPFEEFYLWAGFTMLGETARGAIEI
jgi:hypothetical protein